MTKQSFDFHHILPTSRKGSNHENNRVRLDVRKHRALHMLFDNQTPPEQVARLMGINSTALSESFKEDVSRILTLAEDPEYTYTK